MVVLTIAATVEPYLLVGAAIIFLGLAVGFAAVVFSLVYAFGESQRRRATTDPAEGYPDAPPGLDDEDGGGDGR